MDSALLFTDNGGSKLAMLEQVKQIEEFFRHEVSEEKSSRVSHLPPQTYDMKELTGDSHSSKEVETLRRKIATLEKELAGTWGHFAKEFSSKTAAAVAAAAAAAAAVAAAVAQAICL